MSILPSALQQHVFSNLSMKELNNCKKVNRSFYQMALGEKNIRELFSNEERWNRQIHSIKDLEEKMESFLGRISKETKGARFTCFFPLHQGSKIHIEISKGNVEVEEKWYCIKDSSSSLDIKKWIMQKNHKVETLNKDRIIRKRDKQISQQCYMILSLLALEWAAVACSIYYIMTTELGR